MKRLNFFSFFFVLILLFLIEVAQADLNGNTPVIMTPDSGSLTIATGESVRVYGSSAPDTVIVESGGQLYFYNAVGQNVIRINQNSSGFTVQRSGAMVILENTNSDTFIKLPSTCSTQSIIFSDFSTTLVIDNVAIKLGDQLVTNTPASIKVENAEPVQLGIEFSSNKVKPGHRLEATFTVANSSSTPLENVRLQFRYPKNLNSLHESYFTVGGWGNEIVCPGYDRCDTNEIGYWNLNTIPAGKAVRVSMVPYVSSSAADGTEIPFEMEILVNGNQVLTADKSIFVDADQPFKMTIDQRLTPIKTNSEQEYIINYSNLATDADDLELIFSLPVNTTLVNGTGVYTQTGNDLVWNLGFLASGESGEQRVVVNQAGIDGNLLEAEAQLSGYENYKTHEVGVNSINYIDNGTKPLVGMSISPLLAKAGESMNIDLTVTNPTSQPMSDVQVVFRYPLYLNSLHENYFMVGGWGNEIVCPGYDRCDTNEIGYWNLNTIQPGKGVTVSLPPSVWSEAPDGALSQFKPEIWVNGVQETALSQAIIVESDRPFKIDINEPVKPGKTAGEHEYTIIYSNEGSDAQDVKLRFTLPDGVNLVGDGNGASVQGDDLVWDIGYLTSGNSGEKKIVITADKSVGAILETEARFSGTVNWQDYVVYAHSINYLEEENKTPLLGMSMVPQIVKPGEGMNIELTVTNPTSQPMSDVQVIFRYPRYLNSLYESYFMVGGSGNTIVCPGYDRCDTNEIGYWNLNTIPPGKGVTVSLPPSVWSEAPDGALFQFKPEVWVNGEQKMAVSKIGIVDSVRPFKIRIDESAMPAQTGDDLEYTITYSNQGAESSNIQLCVPLPENTSLEKVTDGGELWGDEVVWNLSNLQNGSGGSQKIIVTPIDGNDGNLLGIENAKLSGTADYDDFRTYIGDITYQDENDVPVMTMNLSSNIVQPGETIDVELIVANPTANPISDVKIYLRYPKYLNALYETYFTTGGTDNWIACPGYDRCDTSEIAVWGIGIINPGQSITVGMPAVVNSSTSSGSLIQFQPELWANGMQKMKLSETVFVGGNFQEGAYND